MVDLVGTVDLGSFSLAAAWLLSLYSLTCGVYGALRVRPAVVASGKTALVLSFVFLLLAFVSLVCAFVSHDFSYLYVWQTSSRTMPLGYLICAVWGGMDGSMLLWALLLGLYSVAVVKGYGGFPLKFMAWVYPVLSSAVFFFSGVTAFFFNPFRLLPANFSAADGNGLNPILQNPSMIFHPPLLYLGFTGFVVPFAFCLAGLLSGETSGLWTRCARRWVMLSWCFLTTGIILGGNWAYIELGWGGFWGWDPVENASLLPWLTATALLHSMIVEEKRGMLKCWTSVLCLLTYILTVFGTFITRSGVVQSVHAFVETDIGWIFVAYLALLLVFSSGVLVWRWPMMRSARNIESFVSREFLFLLNNLVLLAICFAVFWGVMFPIISEALGGEKSVVGPPFFNKVTSPFFLVLLFLMGVGPALSWKADYLRNIVKRVLLPLLASILVCFVVSLVIGVWEVFAILAFSLCLFVLLLILWEFRRGASAISQADMFQIKVRRFASLSLLLYRPRKYGGLLVHLGIVVMAASITASMVFKIEQDVTLRPGEKSSLAGISFELKSVNEKHTVSYRTLVAEVELVDERSKKLLSVLHPERRIYGRRGEATSEVSIWVTPFRDVYLALAGIDSAENESIDLANVPVLFKVFVNPFQVWLWVGSFLVVAAGLFVSLYGMRATGLPASRFHGNLKRQERGSWSVCLVR